MLNVLYFLLLLGASVEDYKYHRVKPGWTLSIAALGLLNCITKENRWVTLALTCACFFLLFLLYKFIRLLAAKHRLSWQFGGADVRLIPGMMLMQGWDVALTGIFAGLLAAAVYYLFLRQKQKEIPLVPWMSAGCLLAEIIAYGAVT